jgi:phosphopantetheinyl transferase
MTRVLLMHARLRGSAVPEALASLMARLPYAKRLDLERREPDARSASLAGLWLALEGTARLRGRAADVAALRFSADGKPHLAGGPFFSISHGLTHVAAAVCESTEIGFDLEEADAGTDGSQGVREKLQRWTATEAVLKAAGRDLREAGAVNLEALLATATLEGMGYWLWPVAIATDVVAHLAAPTAVESVEVVELDLPATT